jgi:hypothetical protein
LLFQNWIGAGDSHSGLILAGSGLAGSGTCRHLLPLAQGGKGSSVFLGFVTFVSSHVLLKQFYFVPKSLLFCCYIFCHLPSSTNIKKKIYAFITFFVYSVDQDCKNINYYSLIK